MDISLIEKFLKVRALALRGSDGEKANAKKILEKMEAENPGLARAAAAHYKKQQQAEGDPESWQDVEPKTQKKQKAKSKKKAGDTPPGVWPKDWEEAAEDVRTGNWENIFRYAQQAFTGVYGFAENVSNAYAGRELAYEVEPETKMSKTGTMNVMLKMPLKVFNQVSQLNGMQRAAFRQTLHEFLDAQLDAMFGEEDK